MRLPALAAPDKTRPVLVLTRQSSIDVLARVTVAPITSTIRGVPSEVLLGPDDGMMDACAINLHDLVTVNEAHFGRRLAVLRPGKLHEVCQAIAFSLGCES